MTDVFYPTPTIEFVLNDYRGYQSTPSPNFWGVVAQLLMSTLLGPVVDDNIHNPGKI